jgi:cellulose 1,4-beta-cellobiosidase
MIWLNSQGGVQPSGSVVASGVNIDGATYNVWFSQDSGSKYVAYRKTKVSTSLSPDIKAFINDAVSRGYLQSSWSLIAVEAGFEIWNGGVGMGTNSFSVSVSGDGG